MLTTLWLEQKLLNTNKIDSKLLTSTYLFENANLSVTRKESFQFLMGT